MLPLFRRRSVAFDSCFLPPRLVDVIIRLNTVRIQLVGRRHVVSKVAVRGLSRDVGCLRRGCRGTPVDRSSVGVMPCAFHSWNAMAVAVDLHLAEGTHWQPPARVNYRDLPLSIMWWRVCLINMSNLPELYRCVCARSFSPRGLHSAVYILTAEVRVGQSLTSRGRHSYP